MPSTTTRVFQIAKLLKVDSAEILDALSDMGRPVSSDLAPLDADTVEELRSLFKPNPKTAKVKPADKASKPKVVKKTPADPAAAAPVMPGPPHAPAYPVAPAAGTHPAAPFHSTHATHTTHTPTTPHVAPQAAYSP